MKIKDAFEAWKQKAKQGFPYFLGFIAFSAITILFPRLVVGFFLGILVLVVLLGFPYVIGDIVSDHKEENGEE
jgi:hypothetical protein